MNELLKTGTGTLTLTKINTYPGATIVNAGELVVNGKILGSSGVAVNAGGTLGGNGSVPTTIVQGGGFFAPGVSPGPFTVGSLSLATDSTFQEQLGGTTAGTLYAQTVIAAQATVTLNNPALSISLTAGFLPAAGQQFTIIKNQGGSAVAGTFSQGSTLTSNGYVFAINYAGGAGHDVVLTVLGQTSTMLTSSVGVAPNAAVFGQSVTFTATVSANSPITGTPTGTVTFLDGSNVLGTASLSQGSATFTTSTLNIGSHNITASFSGTSSWLNSMGSMFQVVNQAATTTTLVSSQNASVLNQSVTFTATVSANAPGAGTPSGMVTFMDGATTLGAVALNGVSGNDLASFSTSSLAAATHNITAVYQADSNFLSSPSSVLGQSIVTTPQLQGGMLALPGTVAAATITLTPTLPAGATAYGIKVSYKVGGTTTNYGVFAASNITLYGGPGTDAVILNGTSGNDTFVIGNGILTENAAQSTLFTVALNGVASTAINGIGGGDGLIGPNLSNAWVINGGNAGSLNGSTTFQNIANLTGGSSNDTFALTGSAFLTGSINGGGGTNTLDYSAFTTQVTFDMTHLTSSRLTTAYANIQNVIAGTFAANPLIGPAGATTFNVTGANSGNVNGVSFANFGRLVGGVGNDIFKFSDGASLSSSVEGGAGTNTIDESAYTTPVTANGSTSTITGIGVSYAHITSLVGGIASNTLAGPTAGSTYNITGSNSGTVGAMTFSKFGTLVGAAGNDTFKFNSTALLTGSIDGGTGTNTLDYSALATQVTLNLATLTASRITSPFSNIQNIKGGTFAANPIIGPAVSTTFNITGMNTVTVNGLSFSSFGKIIGGAADDTFVLSNGAGLSNGIDGGPGMNWLDYSAYTTPSVVNLSTGAATGFGSAIANIRNVRGGSANDTLTGNNQGNILIGGAGNDTINGGSGRNLLIGGLGSDTITGGSNNDILISGTTSLDGNFAALDAILAEWSSITDSYATRISRIKNGGGLNGSTTLNWGTSVIDDGAADILLGKAGTDWFLEGTNDTSDAQSGEQIN